MLGVFSCTYQSSCFLLWNVYSNLLSVFSCAVCLLINELLKFFTYSGYKYFYQICRYFLPVNSVSFCFLSDVFSRAEVFNFDGPIYQIFLLQIMFLVSYLGNFCLAQDQKDFLLWKFSSRHFIEGKVFNKECWDNQMAIWVFL